MSDRNLFSVAEEAMFHSGAKAPITWLVDFVDGQHHKGTVARLDREVFRLEVDGGEFGVNKTIFFELNKVVRIRPV